MAKVTMNGHVAPKFDALRDLLAASLEAAFAAARGDALRRGVDEIIVAGGAEIYARAMTVATRLAVTEVHKCVEGDARFPAIDRDVWREIDRHEQQPGAEDEAAFAFVTYRRAAASDLPGAM